ncbi:MAG TPA: hypothetical protein VGX78_02640 [Pirellulales bacterium]|jgi:hypothetical protein|nr:hypothetical protein [Pirellulales bacterium]
MEFILRFRPDLGQNCIFGFGFRRDEQDLVAHDAGQVEPIEKQCERRFERHILDVQTEARVAAHSGVGERFAVKLCLDGRSVASTSVFSDKARSMAAARSLGML